MASDSEEGGPWAALRVHRRRDVRRYFFFCLHFWLALAESVWPL
jgi:hypothetical protein